MRVDDPYSATGFDVLKDQVAEERRLSRSAFPDSVEMMPSIVFRNAEGHFVAPIVPRPDDNVMSHISSEPLLRLESFSLNTRRVSGRGVFFGDIRF